MAYINQQPYGKQPYGYPVPIQAQPQRTGEWQHGLCKCHEVPLDCLLACCCIPYYAVVAARGAGDNVPLSVYHGVFLPWCLVCTRGRVREERGIEGSCLKDCLLAWCCSCCAYIQLKREVTPQEE